MSQPKNFLVSSNLNRPNSALHPFNMMTKLPSENPNFSGTQIKKDSQKIKKLPIVEKLVKKPITLMKKETSSNILPPLEQNKIMNKSDTFLNDELKKQISKPFNRKSIKTKLSSSSTIEPSKSLKESLDYETKTEENLEEESHSQFLSRSLDYSLEMNRIFEKKNKEKMQTISELNNFLHDIEQKNSVSFPTNYNNFVQIFADDVKFSKEHLSPENLEKNLQDMKIDFNLKTQKLQKIKALEKILTEKEKQYKDLLKKRDLKDNFSETSSNCSDNSKKLFITDFKTKRVQPGKEEKKCYEDDQNPILFIENSSNKYPNKDFVEFNKINVIPLRYQFFCDTLPEAKKERLNELLKDIGNCQNVNRLKSEDNPFSFNEQSQEKFQEIDQKLLIYAENKKKTDCGTLEEINEELYNLSKIERNQHFGEKLQSGEIENLIYSLKNSEHYPEFHKTNLEKFDNLEHNIQNLEKRGLEILQKLNLKELISEVSLSKKMIEDSLINLIEYKKKLEAESKKEQNELEEEYKQKRTSYFKEVLLKLNEEYAHVNELYNETSEFEKKLNGKVNLILKEFDENKNNWDNEVGIVKDSEGKEVTINFQTKTLEEYDREINAAVKNLYPEIFQDEIE